MMRIAAIGVGHWHSVYDAGYLKLLPQISGVRLVGLHDPDEQLARRRAEQLGRSTPVFDDYRKMIEHVQPDAVIVLGRHSAMAEAAEYLIGRAIPFLVEKPMGLDQRQVAGIVRLAAARRAFVAVPFTYRYQPYVERIDALLAAGRLGRVRHLSFRLMRPTQRRYADWDCGWMLDQAESGGGALRNLGPHGLDLFLRYAGPQAQVLSAATTIGGPGEVEDFASVQVRSEAGVLGTVEVGNLYPAKVGRDATLAVYGSDGAVTVRDGTMQVIDADGVEQHTLPTGVSTAVLALRAAFSSIRDGRPPPGNAADCLRVVQLIDQAYTLASHY